MARQRTKQQKQRAQLRHRQQLHETSVTLPMNSSNQPTAPTPPAVPLASGSQSANDFAVMLKKISNQASKSSVTDSAKRLQLQTFFGFDPRLIYQDLTKTLIISGIIIAILVVFSRLSF